jgi:flagellar basal-body rod protein FlgG
MAITALYTAATGMQAMSTKIDVIANNIANADTVGFKASRANFQDLLYQIQAQPGVETGDDITAPLGTQIGLGVALSNTQLLFQQGSAMQGINTDAMIQGDGFFQVDLPGGGTGYTRAGNWVVASDGRLVLGNSQGFRLKDSPTIPDDVPADKVSFTADGQIVVSRPDGTVESLGQLELARFVNPSGLLQYGSNIYQQSPASGDPQTGNPGENGLGTILPGYLELSTTESVAELVELIKTQRIFQMNSQTIQTSDEALQTVANLRR